MYRCAAAVFCMLAAGADGSAAPDATDDRDITIVRSSGPGEP